MFDKFQSSSPAPQLSASTPFSSKRYAWSLKFSLLFSLCVDRSTEPAGSFVLLLSIPDTTSSLAMRAELLPHLCSRYKALPPSVYLRPKFRQCMWGELSESSVPWGKKRKGEDVVFIYLSVFVLSHKPWFSSPFFLWCGLLGADPPGLNKDIVFLLKAMVAYDELGSLVPIKRTLQVIDYQNQANKESEVRC